MSPWHRASICLCQIPCTAEFPFEQCVVPLAAVGSRLSSSVPTPVSRVDSVALYEMLSPDKAKEVGEDMFCIITSCHHYK